MPLPRVAPGDRSRARGPYAERDHRGAGAVAMALVSAPRTPLERRSAIKCCRARWTSPPVRRAFQREAPHLVPSRASQHPPGYRSPSGRVDLFVMNISGAVAVDCPCRREEAPPARDRGSARGRRRARYAAQRGIVHRDISPQHPVDEFGQCLRRLRHRRRRSGQKPRRACRSGPAYSVRAGQRPSCMAEATLQPRVVAYHAFRPVRTMRDSFSTAQHITEPFRPPRCSRRRARSSS